MSHKAVVQVLMPEGWTLPSEATREKVQQASGPEDWKNWPRHMRTVLGLPPDATDAQVREAKHQCGIEPYAILGEA